MERAKREAEAKEQAAAEERRRIKAEARAREQEREQQAAREKAERKRAEKEQRALELKRQTVVPEQCSATINVRAVRVDYEVRVLVTPRNFQGEVLLGAPRSTFEVHMCPPGAAAQPRREQAFHVQPTGEVAFVVKMSVVGVCAVKVCVLKVIVCFCFCSHV